MSQAKLALQLKVRLATIAVLLLMAEGVSLLVSSELRATASKYSVYHKLFGTANIQFVSIVEQLNQLNKVTSVPGDSTPQHVDIITVEKLNEAINKVPDDFLLYQIRANRLETSSNRGLASDDRAKAQMFEKISATRASLLSTVYLAGIALLLVSSILLVRLGKWLEHNFLQLPIRLAAGAAVAQYSMIWLFFSVFAGGPLGWLMLGAITGVTTALMPVNSLASERVQNEGAVLHNCAKATCIGVLIWLLIVSCDHQFFFGDVSEIKRMIEALDPLGSDSVSLKLDGVLCFALFAILLLIAGFFAGEQIRRKLLRLSAQSQAEPLAQDGNFKQ